MYHTFYHFFPTTGFGPNTSEETYEIMKLTSSSYIHIICIKHSLIELKEALDTIPSSLNVKKRSQVITNFLNNDLSIVFDDPLKRL